MLKCLETLINFNNTGFFQSLTIWGFKGGIINFKKGEANMTFTQNLRGLFD